MQGFLVSVTVSSSRILHLKVDLQYRHKPSLFQGQGEIRKKKKVYAYISGRQFHVREEQ